MLGDIRPGQNKQPGPAGGMEAEAQGQADEEIYKKIKQQRQADALPCKASIKYGITCQHKAIASCRPKDKPVPSFKMERKNGNSKKHFHRITVMHKEPFYIFV